MQQNPQRADQCAHAKHRCLACARHRSVFAFRGRVHADADHNLCPRCYRSHRQRLYNWFAGSLGAAPRARRRIEPTDQQRSITNAKDNDDEQRQYVLRALPPSRGRDH